ncbi:MAG: hypothetical protein ACJ8C4_13850 [Gemmataceae bacterium]
MAWTRSIDITQWSERIEARAQLPMLLRRLVWRTAPTVKSINFPTAEQTYRPGFDGLVDTVTGNRFVPDGLSGWEMGVDKNPENKANSDFEKRSEEFGAEQSEKYAFVFVTPRSWLNKDTWANVKAAGSNWRQVRVLDVNDLEHWLDTAPDVDIWFARLIGKAPSGVQDITSYWNSIRLIGENPLTEAVFTTSRDEEINVLQDWLGGSPSALFLRSSGLTDSLDFLAALSSREGQHRLQNALIVDSLEAWKVLTARHESLVLVATPTLELQASDCASAIEAGHFVLLSGPRVNASIGSVQNLRRQDVYSLTTALNESGYSESQAAHFAKACSGSSSILKRLITRLPHTAFPEWSHNRWRTSLAPFALVGGWVHVDPSPPKRDPEMPRIGADPPIDVHVVSELVGETAPNIDLQVSRWQQGPEPLFLRFGHSVFIASREDAWHLLGGNLSDVQLKRFAELAVLVLEEDNPAFELPSDQRWAANIYGKVHAISAELRKSIVETLVLMTVYPTADEPISTVTYEQITNNVLEKVLPRQSKWQRWASLGNNLSMIAEANPEFFLGRVEEDLRSPDPELPKLFQDQQSSFFGGGALHTDLLWALEGIAWSSDYLSRVASCLARLASSDPGGRYSNRPARSLEEIFLWWLPHTNSPLSVRTAVLSEIIRHFPFERWRLLRTLLPGAAPSASHGTHMPRWRPWADGWSKTKAHRERGSAAQAIADLTVHIAGLDALKWAEIIDGILRFSTDIQTKAFEKLKQIASEKSESDVAKFRLWETLHELVNRHRRYGDSNWALAEEILSPLKEIMENLQPSDLVFKDHWLFQIHVELPNFDLVENHQEHDNALYDQRLNSLRSIIESQSAAGVFRLLELGVDGSAVGWIVGKHALLTWQSAKLPEILNDSSQQQLAFIYSFISGAFQSEGWAFIAALPVASWSTSEKAAFARCLPFGEETWVWLKELGPEAEREYWQTVRGFVRHSNLQAVEFAAKSLIEVGRRFAAVDLVAFAIERGTQMPDVWLADVLDSSLPNEIVPDDNSSHWRYSLQKLIKHLQENKFDKARLARIEWRYLPLLERPYSLVGPETLFDLVHSDPAFFGDVLKTLYRAKHEVAPKTELSENERTIIDYSRRLLDGIKRLPGQAGNNVDIAALREWIFRVREIANDNDRIEICDLVLGQIIARATKRKKRLWPSSEIASLMEEIGTQDLFHGFVSGTLNSRGVVSRDPRSGGQLERILVQRFRDLAANARPHSPKLALAFDELADHYRSYARHEDQEAERERLGR